jgi:hypothetical protein
MYLAVIADERSPGAVLLLRSIIKHDRLHPTALFD